MTDILRLAAEEQYKTELDALIAAETETVPRGWRLSPRSVLTYIIGGTAKGVEITPKYFGNRGLVETAVATLMTDRGLLLLGEPGTAKTWLSEHLAAAVCGDSTLLVQGTMGVSEEAIKYGWNYATLIAAGPTPAALVKTPIYRAMEEGRVARFEELSRCAPEVQDALISILSEKSIAIPELSTQLRAKKGFALIATANTRDRGVNDMSAALKRRFNAVYLPAPATPETEIEIVTRRVAQISAGLEFCAVPPRQAIETVVTIFRELRQGRTLDGRETLKRPTASCSTAEAISLVMGAMAHAAGFGDGTVTDAHIAAGLTGAIVKDDEKDAAVLREYAENVLKHRNGSKSLYERLTAV
ncbi:MAG: AAA family ATPase [Oscillospiraceae bacterium]|jgi:MoxR-like ATPase|nr:AAA family ATPase [Oscillospiraceae bacterium]